ncbi:MAG: PTS sugar transporter subunit IIC/EAL domain-containing protein [Gammaproteobacteria bacterium]|nr:PTS sugar transporter subunit IIC/EAL domain-containing protein [Gammaproteobacteria bacterium]
MLAVKGQTSIFFLSLRESFIGVFPYFVLAATCLLAAQVLKFFDIHWGGVVNSNTLEYAANVLYTFFPFILQISISYHFSKRYNVDYMSAILLSTATFATIEFVTIDSLSNASVSGQLVFTGASSFLNIIVPISTTMFLSFILKEYKLKKYLFINNQINKILGTLYPFIITYFISIFAYIFVLDMLSDLDLKYLDSLDLSDNFLMVARTVLIDLFWFFGVHGLHAFDALFGDEFLYRPVFTGMTYQKFFELFVFFGGSGATLSLLIALYIDKKDKKDSRFYKIAKLATPFSIFNINEIIVFGLPIIFNLKLFIPFIIVPFVNMVLAYFLISLYPIEVVNSVSWTTPIFINAFMATDGNYFAVALQFLLLSVGVLIYFPFIRSYTSSQSSSGHRISLEKNLGVSELLQEKEGVASFAAQKSIIKSNQEVDSIIKLLNRDSLTVYYQPKVDIKHGRCDQFEALLRLKTDTGEVVGPYFLEHLEIAGLAPVIDIWVCREVKRMMVQWGQQGFKPKISVNLHPDTLGNNNVMHQIETVLAGMSVEFEIIERGLLDDNNAKNNIISLKDKGFQIAIDDFGIGYSSFETLCNLPIDSVKLDKSLIDMILFPHGYAICKRMAELCADLGFQCVAEGVEKQYQLNVVAELGIQYVQGYYFSPAISSWAVPYYNPIKKAR